MPAKADDTYLIDFSFAKVRAFSAMQSTICHWQSTRHSFLSRRCFKNVDGHSRLGGNVEAPLSNIQPIFAHDALSLEQGCIPARDRTFCSRPDGITAALNPLHQLLGALRGSALVLEPTRQATFENLSGFHAEFDCPRTIALLG